MIDEEHSAPDAVAISGVAVEALHQCHKEGALPDFWEPRVVESIELLEAEVASMRKDGWLFRGQSRVRGRLVPSIDRPPREHLGRAVKLGLEKQAIDEFRKSVTAPVNQSEMLAMTDPHIALMVLRHYDVPTRILDWSASPYVAAFFASETNHASDGELWAFDRRLYEVEGAKQWDVGPPVTQDGEFQPQYTMFMPELGDIDWFICAFYFPDTFPRQDAQEGAFSLTANFEVDHAGYIARLLKTPERCLRFILPAKLKPGLLRHLSSVHQVDRARLFPDGPDGTQKDAISAARAVFNS